MFLEPQRRLRRVLGALLLGVGSATFLGAKQAKQKNGPFPSSRRGWQRLLFAQHIPKAFGARWSQRDCQGRGQA